MLTAGIWEMTERWTWELTEPETKDMAETWIWEKEIVSCRDIETDKDKDGNTRNVILMTETKTIMWKRYGIAKANYRKHKERNIDK